MYETVKPLSRAVDTPLAYISALRLITGAYAYCGTHEVPSKLHKDTLVRFFPWEVALGYADEVMDQVLNIDIPEEKKLKWVRLRDESTRGEMAQLINDGWPGGEALTEAMKSQAHYWKMEDKTVAAPVISDAPPPNIAEPLGLKRTRDDRRLGARSQSGGVPKQRKGGNPMEGIKVISTDKRGVKYCGKYNSFRGCSRHERDCPQNARHLCSFQIERGVACGRTDHCAVNH